MTPEDQIGWTSHSHLYQPIPSVRDFASGDYAIFLALAAPQSISQACSGSRADAASLRIYSDQLGMLTNRHQQLKASLEEIMKQSSAWCYSDIEAPTMDAIKEAEVLLSRFFTHWFLPNTVVISADGGVGFQFSIGDRYADFECSNNGEVTALVSDGKGMVEAFEVDKSFEGNNIAVGRIRDFLEDRSC